MLFYLLKYQTVIKMHPGFWVMLKVLALKHQKILESIIFTTITSFDIEDYHMLNLLEWIHQFD